MLKLNFYIGFIVVLFLMFSNAYGANEFWSKLDGPYWVNGIDVACGFNHDDVEWHRYLIGNDANDTKLFRWRSSDTKWFQWDLLSGANKLISYKHAHNGNWAICSAYDDDIYRTNDGGLSWMWLDFPDNFNNHFTSVEIVNRNDEPGRAILIASDLVPDLASAYYTNDYGVSWEKLGNVLDPLDNLHVNDLETFPEPVVPPNIAAATDDGIYRHTNGWQTSWTQVAFAGKQVLSLESIDLWDEGKQMAVVVNGNNIKRLYITINHWDNYSEILVDGEPYNKNVIDISAIYWYGAEEPVSCYLATDEGLFLVDFDAENPSHGTLYDLKTMYAPLQHDLNIQAVDYHFRFGADYDTAWVIATSPNNVYEITEIRSSSNNNIESIKIQHIVNGTYMQNVSDLTFIDNEYLGQTNILTASTSKQVERGSFDNWELTATTPAYSGDYVSTDIASERVSPTAIEVNSEN